MESCGEKIKRTHKVAYLLCIKQLCEQTSFFYKDYTQVIHKEIGMCSIIKQTVYRFYIHLQSNRHLCRKDR